MTNTAMQHGPFIDDLAIKRLIFHSYVSLTEGILCGHPLIVDDV